MPQANNMFRDLFWQDDRVNVCKLLCECVDVTLGADRDDQRVRRVMSSWWPERVQSA